MSTPTSKDNSTAIWPVLAGLRFILAVIVLLGHCENRCPTPHWFWVLTQFGPGIAVTSFFIISGFSIAHSIETRPEGFYLRRVERIYPVFVVCFLLALVPFAVWGTHVPMQNGSGKTQDISLNNWTDFGTLFFLNGFLCRTLPTIGVAWSLSLEVFFYALAPWFRRLSTRILLTLIGVSSLCYFFNNVFFPADGRARFLFNLEHGMGALLSAWMWLFGFLYYRHRHESWAKVLLLLLGVFLLQRWNASPGMFNLFTYVFALCCLFFPPKLSPKTAKVASYLGDISYPLYLVHSPLLKILQGGNAQRPWWLFLILAFVAAIALLHFVDYPFRRLAKKWQTKPTPKPTEIPLLDVADKPASV